MHSSSNRLAPPARAPRSARVGFAALLAATALLVTASAGSAGAQEILVPDDAFYRFFRGTEEPPVDWYEPGFVDTAWEEGQSGFGYADGDDTTMLDDMQNNYWSVYIRTKFDVPDLAQVPLAQLRILYDDGFVAYLNGVEIARRGLTGMPPAFDEAATDHEAAAVETITLTEEGMAAFRQGENVLALQGNNGTLASSDFTLKPELVYFTSLCPSAVACRNLSNYRVRLTWTNPVRPAPFTKVEILRDGVIVGEPSTPATLTFTDSEVPCGEHEYAVVAYLGDEACEAVTCTTVMEPDDTDPCPGETGGPSFRRGDVDVNGAVNLTDAISLLLGLFQGGAQPGCPDSADTDDNGNLNLTDAIFLLNHLFLAGVAPPAPGTAACGADPTDDALADCTYDACDA